MLFEWYSKLLQCTFQMLAKDPNEAYSDWQQVELLLKGIKTNNNKLRSTKVVISSQYLCDFVGTCAFFVADVAHIH
jgi:hypothetical protein